MDKHELWCIAEIANYRYLETAKDVIKMAGKEGMEKLPTAIRMALINRAMGKQLDPLNGDVLETEPE